MFVNKLINFEIVWIVSKVSPESIPEPLQPFAGQPPQYQPYPPGYVPPPAPAPTAPPAAAPTNAAVSPA